MIIKSKCELCGKEKEYSYKSVVKRFCSYKCSNQWKWDNVRKKGGMVNCFFCGKEHWRRKGELEKEIKEGFFCSKECFYNFRKGKIPIWLEGFSKGHLPWNKGLKLSNEFKEKCRKRAKEQWKDLNFREKQMKRDFSYLAELGKVALKKWREEILKKLKFVK